MAVVHIPPQLRELTRGNSTAQAAGARLREVIADLDRQFPGIAARLLDGERLTAGLAVSIDGELGRLGLLTPIPAGSEVHFLPALGGG